MEPEVRRILGKDLAAYLELLRAKMAYAEELYGVKINYVPLVTEGEIVVLDGNDGKIKWLRTKRPLTPREFEALADRIRKNLESGFVETLLSMNMSCVNVPGE
ncbi:hypothetical protein A3L12_02720 [Thermococcus sp. P6]|uniref:hypothetical protein n=1 Tax=Thermococcus sp. P6 TaxID=122420 RepID=UPI000B59D5C0|nr:hypothetical protein [Thermococcus sp. P6]ASJ10283.1 hypothetical protein A3L12_02720 [Thermococcus sp. P6]